MAQGFDKTQPVEGSDIQSAPVRINFNALVTDHAGAIPPANPDPGWTWLDTSLSNQPTIRVYWDFAWKALFVYNQSLGKFVSAVGTAEWGAIAGTLSSQADLQAALNGKMPLTPNQITLVRATSNPGGVNTIWIKEPGGHLHRGSVDLEAGASALQVEDEGTPLGAASAMNFVGGGVSVTMVGSTATVNIPAGSVNLHQNVDAVGTKDGINTVFAMPGTVAYSPGTLIVYLNGVAYGSASIIEIGPGYTTFQITSDHVPNSDDSLTVSFIE